MLQDIEDQSIIINHKASEPNFKVTPITPTAEDYDESLINSKFFNKLPTILEMENIHTWHPLSYNYEFMTYHKEHTNWELIKELILDFKIRDLRFLKHLKELKVLEAAAA
jgi:hypothetical protein